MKNKEYMCPAAFGLSLLSGCGKVRQSKNRSSMDTVMTLSAYGDKAEAGHRQSAIICSTPCLIRRTKQQRIRDQQRTRRTGRRRAQLVEMIDVASLFMRVAAMPSI